MIVERAPRSDNIPDIDKKKFLVPSDLTLAQFLFVVRKRIEIPADRAIFVFVESEVSGKKKSIMPATRCVVFVRVVVLCCVVRFPFSHVSSPARSDTLSSIYQANKDDDGFLYLTYAGERTFG